MSAAVEYDYELVKARPCFHCGTSFEIRLGQMLFCGRVCRGKYFRKVKTCFYCNEEATCKDHLLPRSFVQGSLMRCKSLKGTKLHERVRACHPCNRTLGSNIYVDIKDRVHFIIEALERQQIQDRNWEHGDYGDLGRSLALHVKGINERGALLKRRLEYAKALAERITAKDHDMKVFLDDVECT